MKEICILPAMYRGKSGGYFGLHVFVGVRRLMPVFTHSFEGVMQRHVTVFSVSCTGTVHTKTETHTDTLT